MTIPDVVANCRSAVGRLQGHRVTALTLAALLVFSWEASAGAAAQNATQPPASELSRALAAFIANPVRPSPAEIHRLSTLIAADGSPISLEQTLGALRRRQSHQGISLLMSGLAQPWKREPELLAFYRNAILAGDINALWDLTVTGDPPWDDSFIEALVTLVEGATPHESPASMADTTKGVDHALTLLDRRAALWSNDSSIPPRLGRGFRRLHASWLGAPLSFEGSLYLMVEQLVRTQDRAMIAMLRPFLSISTIDPFIKQSSNMPAGVTPMRYRDVAANGILRLLGEPPVVELWKRARVTGSGPYPEWAVWDSQIADLEKRLDGMAR